MPGPGRSPPGSLPPDKLPGLAGPPATDHAAAGPRGAAFGPTLALTVTGALAAVAVVVAAMTLLVDPKPIPGLDATQRQDAESAVYLLSLLVVVPASVIFGPRLAAAVGRGANGEGLSALAALMTAGLAGAVLAGRFVDGVAGGGGTAVLALVLAWWVLSAAGLARARSNREWPALMAAAGRTRVLWLAAAVLVAATPLVVTDLGSLSVVPLVVGVVAVVLVARARLPALRGRWGLAVDVVLVILLALLIPDLVVVRPEDPGLGVLDRYLASIMQFHHDFLVGPANQVLGGDVLLRDTASQYGVGSIYLLVAWFKLMTVSYGSFALLDGLLTAAVYVCAYAVLRMAGCSRALAGSAMGVAVVALVYNRVYPVGMLPQEGPFRFGLPMVVVLAAVAGARWPARAALARGVALAAVAVSAIWALEAFAATVVVFAALALVDSGSRPPGQRLRSLARDAGLVVAATVAGHVLFALATLAGTGELPGWGQYLAFLHTFLVGDLGDLTYDFSRWSAGLGLGAAYLASTLALLVLLRLRPAVAASHRATVVALTGATAYGLVQFAYFVDRSADHVTVYVALPAVMAAALWLGLVLRSPDAVPRDARVAALVVAAAVGALLVSVGWSSIARPLGRSALSQLVPGGDSPRGAIARLRAFPAIDPRAPEGERLLDTAMPGEKRSVVLVDPDLTVEILIRRGRSNALPLSDPREDDFTLDERLPGIRRAVRDLRPGRRILVDAGALSALAAVRRDPSSPLLRRRGRATAAVQVQALNAIDRRFRLRVVQRGAGGLFVLQLGRR